MTEDTKTGTRTVLVHLNVTVEAYDDRNADAVARALEDALYVGLEGAPDYTLGGIGEISVVLAEEV
jgi:hypothetical protein